MFKSPLLDQVREVLRLRHYSIRTEEAYVQAIRRFINFHRKRHPREMGVDEIRQHLSHLAIDGKVAASTQNVALCALLFLYRQVLAIDLPLIENVERAKRPKRVPVVFTPEEVRRVLAKIRGTLGFCAIWCRPSIDGVCTPAGQRSRLPIQTNHRAGWQRRA